MTTLSAKVQLFIIYRCLQLKYDMESHQHQPAPSVLLSFWLVLGYMPRWSDYDYKDWAAPAMFYGAGAQQREAQPRHNTKCIQERASIDIDNYIFFGSSPDTSVCE